MRQSHLHRFLVAYKIGGSAVAWDNLIYTNDYQDLSEDDLLDITQKIRSKEEFSGCYGEDRSFVITNISYLGKSLPTDFKTEAWKQPCLQQRNRGKLI